MILARRLLLGAPGARSFKVALHKSHMGSTPSRDSIFPQIRSEI